MRNSAFIFVLSFVIGLGNSRLNASIELQPHRAYYTISMVGQPSLHSDINDIRGTMMVEYSKVNGGWTVQHLSEVWRYHGDDTAEHVRWGYVTFESEDGSVFKFRTFRKVDNVLQEDIVGVAKRKGDVIEVKYQKPQAIKVNFSGAVLFPLQHIKGLLNAAEEGDHMFPQLVFDGSSTEGPSEIDTFIGAKKVSEKKQVINNSTQFEGQAYWPIRFSVYGLGKINYEPEYVTTQNLLPNGIFTQYTIDDGSVKLRGVLERVEHLSGEG